MEYTRLGSSGLKVSRIALGTMGFGDGKVPFWSWALPWDDAKGFFAQALDLGMNFWDTANVYGAGSSEEIVGRALAQTRRDDVVLATKVHQKVGDGPGGEGLSRKAIMEQVDLSLTRLGTDYIDLYQIHRFDPYTPVEETMEALHDVVKAGKARYLGASSMFAWQFAKMQHVAELHGWTKFVSMQDQYNLVQRGEEQEMFPLLADQGVGSLPWSPLAAGVVARPWGQSNTTRGKDNPQTDFDGNPLWRDSDKPTIDAVERIAKDRGVPMATIALAWVLKNPVVDAPIVGATKPHHLPDAVAALDITLTRRRDHRARRALHVSRADLLLIRLRPGAAPTPPTGPPSTQKVTLMASWSTDPLKAIAENADLFVSPFREDGTTYGTPTQTWALVVDGNVYVRAANGPKSRWYQAAVAQGAGRVRVAGQNYDVTFEAAGDENEAAIDAAYEAKYPGSSAVTTMQGEGPKSASVRISPR